MDSSHPLPDDVYVSLCASLGRVVLSWALAESALDMMGSMIFHFAGGEHQDSKLSISFSRKVKFLTRCFSSIDALSSYRETYLPLLENAKECADTRHFLIHGTLSQIEAHEPWRLTFKMLKLKKDGQYYDLRTLTISVEEIMRFPDKIDALTLALQDVCGRLQKDLMT